MDDDERRPAKRLKVSESFKTNDGSKNSVVGSTDTKTTEKRIKLKTKRVGGGNGIMNTIEREDLNSKKKAISVGELKALKENKKTGLSSKMLTSVIDLNNESDVSTNAGSSPFKIIRSSQEFNIDSPLNNRNPLVVGNDERSNAIHTPIAFKTRPSSDDGIFWITTPQSGNDMSLVLNAGDVSVNMETKLPSSPLKDNQKDASLTELPDTLLDPELKNLLGKYDKMVRTKTLAGNGSDSPTLNRANSDSKALNTLHQSSKGSKASSTQIIASKSTLNDSVKNSLRKVSGDKSSTENDNLDLSRMLVQIATKLKTSNTNVVVESNEEHSEMEIKKEPKKDIDDEGSDDFSDDIDFSEVLMNATQAAPVKPQNTQAVVESDDSFSDDDDDDLMDKIELGLTQNQLRPTGRSVTDQTDVEEFGNDGIETNKVISEIKEMNINFTNTINRYKGMVVTNELENMNDSNNKPFQLYDEKENLAKSAINYSTSKRFQIKDIHQGIFKRDSQANKQYVLKCLTPDDTYINIMVRDHWTSLNFKVNDVIHIIATNENGRYQLVDKDQNLLIWNPDTLISATRIADAVGCKRKSIINQKFAGPGVVGLPLILGTIVHSLFQQCLTSKRLDEEFVSAVISEEINLHIYEIYMIDKSSEDIKNMVLEHFSYIKDWIKAYIPDELDQYNYTPDKRTEFKATNVLNIEENILSPVFGIRGLIDVVIEAQMNDNSKLVVPLEIKTGREYISNKAQVSLYTLLVKQRYNVESFYTSLVYTKLQQCYLSAIKHNDIKLLINIRNELSQYLVYAVTEMPPILEQSSCERCFVVNHCMVLNKLTEDGTAEKSGIDPQIYNDLTDQLDNPLYKKFYTHWDRLITKEEGLLQFAKADLWRKTSDNRESNGGNCVSNLKVISCDYNHANQQYVYIFKRDDPKRLPLNTSQLAISDRVIISDEEGNFGLATGFVKSIKPTTVIITTSNNWSDMAVKLDGFDKTNNQVFKSVLGDPSEINTRNLSLATKSKLYRIDKDLISVGMATARHNLLNLFLPITGDYKTRGLVVDLRKPEFGKPRYEYDTKNSTMNKDQIRAIDKVSQIEDYALILGMPGTGKTTVISTIIDCIVKKGMTVLITSYTHSAVDNICEKLIRNAEERGEELSLLRVGALSKISSIVQPYAMNGKEFEEKVKSKKDFDKAIDCQIVASTCLGISDVFFTDLTRFDYCIVDEASQVALPIVLGPISFSDKFILVGDHYQLPPLVIHPEAKQDGLDQSLFKILSEAHPESVCELTYQYRMCSDIMSLSNELIYDGRLKCGSEKVSNQMLKMPFFESLPIRDTCINEIIRPERRVVFIDEDYVKNIHEISFGDKIENPGEAKLIAIVIKSLVLSGVREENIGVMSFYRAQLKHFFQYLNRYKDIEILTADRFQGRDKDVIIISLVRSEVLGDLLKEWRRVNVAMTRAKCKLMIFGSKKLLESSKEFKEFMDLINCNGWCYSLKESDEKEMEEVDFFQNEFNLPVSDSQGSINISRNTTQNRIDSQSKVIQKSKILKSVMEDIQ